MWRSGNLEIGEREYFYEINIDECPNRLGIFNGRIIELYLYDDQDQKIAEYNKKWMMAPAHGTDAYKLVGQITKEHNFRKKGRYSAWTDIPLNMRTDIIHFA